LQEQMRRADDQTLAARFAAVKASPS